MKKIAVFAFLAFTLFVGCKSATQAPQSLDVIMPLAVGNAWYYTIDNFDSTGTKIETTLDELMLTNKHDVNGEMRYTIKNGGDIAKRDNAIVTFASTHNALSIWIKYPIQISAPEAIDTFVITSEFSPDPIENAKLEMTYLANAVPVSVPAGNYNTLQYQYDGIGLSTDSLYYRTFDYYALNIGLILHEEYVPNSVTGKFYLVSRKRLTKVVLN